MNSITGVLIAVFLLFGIAQESSALRCWQQLCRECSEDSEDGPGNDVTCELKSLVAKHWLDDGSMDTDDNSRNSNKLEFSCLKLKASDPKIVGQSTDIIRGCVLKSMGNGLCTALTNIEVHKGKENAECNICNEDNCNGATGQGVASMFLVALSIFARFLFY